MIGTELTEYGRLTETPEGMLVHIDLPQGRRIAPHNHIGQRVYFTVVKGTVDVCLNDSEYHTMAPGAVLTFLGEATISAQALTDADIFVTLINRTGE